MTPEEFKQRWDSNDTGGGITFGEIAECAKKWGITSVPRTQPIGFIVYRVLKRAGTKDAEDWAPLEEDLG